MKNKQVIATKEKRIHSYKHRMEKRRINDKKAQYTQKNLRNKQQYIKNK